MRASEVVSAPGAAAFVLSVLIAGCFSMGAEVSGQQLTSFEKGKTTYSQVVAELGQPISETDSSEGGRIASWTYFETKTRPSTFVPIIGPFIGGVDSRSNTVQMRFDQAGTLQGYT